MTMTTRTIITVLVLLLLLALALLVGPCVLTSNPAAPSEPPPAADDTGAPVDPDTSGGAT